MPIPTADTDSRRRDARATLIAIEAYDNTLSDTDRVILTVAATILARPKPNAEISADQRRALFASFGEVFGHTDRPARLAFTGMVLGKSPTAVSWSSSKPGALTAAEASKVLDALDALNV